jgi:hypothetical protein
MMKLHEELFEKAVEQLALAGGGRVGRASPEVARWLESMRLLPPRLVSFLSTHSPKTELWAGAGCIFDEATIMRRNVDFPGVILAGLFIIGSAPNGDLVVLDLDKSPGAIGYLMHEQMYSVQDIRSVFVPVCESVGEFVSRINADERDLPNDYFEAVALRQ